MSGRLRVAIVVPGWNGPGENVVLTALADLLWSLARDHDLRIVALRHPPRRAGYVDLGGIPVETLGLGSRGGPSGRVATLAAGIRAVLALHREAPLDLVHAFWADEPGAVAVTAGRLLGRPVIVSAMGGELAALRDIGYGAALGRGGRLTTRLSMAQADLVTVGSSTLYRTVSSNHPAVPILRLPLGVDTHRFSPAATPSPAPNVLFVGSLTGVKDPVLMLRTFARVRPSGAALTIAGDGPMRAGLERLAWELGIAERVRFLGSVPRGGLPAVYRSARVLLVTSWHEAQSMVVVEAAATGVPVVGLGVGVVPELASAGGGRSVAPRDPSALAGAVDELLDRPSGASPAARARAYALRTWDLQGTAGRVAAVWRELAGRGTGDRR